MVKQQFLLQTDLKQKSPAIATKNTNLDNKKNVFAAIKQWARNRTFVAYSFATKIINYFNKNQKRLQHKKYGKMRRKCCNISRVLSQQNIYEFGTNFKDVSNIQKLTKENLVVPSSMADRSQ